MSRYLVGVVTLVCALAAPTEAQVALSPDFQVNTYTTSAQQLPSVASDGSGNFVVVWESYGQDGSFHGIFGRRFSAAGPLGAEFQANTDTAYVQFSPAVAADPAGKFVVAWTGSGPYAYVVWVRRYDASGTPQGAEFPATPQAPGASSESHPALAMDGSGNFVVVWASQIGDGSGDSVRGQRFDAQGARQGAPFLANSFTTGHQTQPSVASDAAGNFVVTWQSAAQDGSGTAVVGRRYSASGQPLGDEFVVNSYTTGDQRHATVALGESGSFIVAWESGGFSESDRGVFVRRYDGAGLSQASEFRVSPGPTVGAAPAIASDGTRNFVVVWTHGDGDGSAVGGRALDRSGTPVGAEFVVNAYTTGEQRNASVAVERSGRFVVAWQSVPQDGDGYGVFGRRLALDLIFRDGFE